MPLFSFFVRFLIVVTSLTIWEICIDFSSKLVLCMNKTSCRDDGVDSSKDVQASVFKRNFLGQCVASQGSLGTCEGWEGWLHQNSVSPELAFMGK